MTPVVNTFEATQNLLDKTVFREDTGTVAAPSPPAGSSDAELTQELGSTAYHGLLTRIDSALSVSLQPASNSAFDRSKSEVRTGRTSLKALGAPYARMLGLMEAHMSEEIEWREGFRACSRNFSEFVAKTYNEYADTGLFNQPVDPDQLRALFEQGVTPFSKETFEKYDGAALGNFHTYNLATRKEIQQWPIYSVWLSKTLDVDDRYLKPINGSRKAYIAPDGLPEYLDHQVDLTMYLYHEEVGLTSLGAFYQNERRVTASIAYDLNNEKTLWFGRRIFTHR